MAVKIALGIHMGHDRGVAIIKDGTVIGAISQERLDRIKHSSSSKIPVEAINSLLEYLNLSFKDISCIGISYNSVEGLSVENFYKEELEEIYDCTHTPIFFSNHHTAHAYASYFSSGFNEALVFVADGAGDYINGMQEAETLFVAQKNKVEMVCRRLQNPTAGKMSEERNYLFSHMPSFIKDYQISLGKKYSQITHLLSLGINGEGKTMGLAGYGTPLFNYNAYKKGDYFDFSLKYKDLLEEIGAMQTLSGRTHRVFLQEERANIASTLQLMLENTTLSLLEDIFKLYQCKSLVLSGGIFLNCLLNYKIIERFNLDNFFVLPPAGDDGQALGAAYYAYSKYFGIHNNFKINLPYLGISYSNSEIIKSLKDANLTYKILEDDKLAKEIAKRISSNKIVALHRGRTEIGPRALCHRSILANPQNPKIKDILNSKVKHRESFRPFAPTVVSEEQFNYFNLEVESKFMNIATTVKDTFQLPGITHIDGTARVQSISVDSEPFVHKILIEIEKKIGVPIMVNTSFNVDGEPIVESPIDAIETFLKTQIDTLVIGNCIVDKMESL